MPGEAVSLSRGSAVPCLAPARLRPPPPPGQRARTGRGITAEPGAERGRRPQPAERSRAGVPPDRPGSRGRAPGAAVLPGGAGGTGGGSRGQVTGAAAGESGDVATDICKRGHAGVRSRRRCETILDAGLALWLRVFFPLLPLSFSFQLLLFLDPRLSPPTEREREREKKRSRMFGKICRSVEHSLHLCTGAGAGVLLRSPLAYPPPQPGPPGARRG